MNMKHLLAVACLFTSVISFGQGTLDSGLIRYYPFNGDAKDMSAAGIDATVNNATLTLNRFGDSNSAYMFNGNDATITFDGTGCDSNAFSFSLWANIEFDNSYNNGVGTYGLMYIGNASNNDHGITTGAGGVQWTVGSYNSDATLFNILSGVEPTASTWHHLAFSRDADSIKL
ncbi:MAG: hypothetical protein GC180_03115 [Bacteroidetes bacterium]|nr:hypothetical protein [Bacteroidota bacterium]